jgi:hypothetical protein
MEVTRLTEAALSMDCDVNTCHFSTKSYLISFRQLFPYLIQNWPHLMVLQQLPHGIRGLSHSEVETPIHRALWPTAPKLPGPSQPAADSTLTPLVHLMLSQQNEYTRKQPYYLVFAFRWFYLDSLFRT